MAIINANLAKVFSEDVFTKMPAQAQALYIHFLSVAKRDDVIAYEFSVLKKDLDLLLTKSHANTSDVTNLLSNGYIVDRGDRYYVNYVLTPDIEFTRISEDVCHGKR